jgi:hypothetical protein
MTTKKDETVLEVEVVGNEYRDNTNDANDANYDPEKGRVAFEFDLGAKTERVDHIAVAAGSRQLVLEINGTYYDFDAQIAGALRRLVQAGATNLNL